MQRRLIDIVARFSRQPVLLVGDFMLDRYVYGDAERISPEAPVPVLRVVRREERVGGAGSVAANLAALGAIPICCGVLGADAHGERVRELLSDCGADCSGLLSVEGLPTTTKTRLVGLAQHRHPQQLLRVDEEQCGPPPTDVTDRLLAFARKRMEQVQVVCLQDYNKGVITREVVATLTEAARALDKPVLVDPAPIRDYGKYRGAGVITPNRREFQLATGIPSCELQTIREHAPTLVDALDLQALIVTLDREGALLIRRSGRPEHLPTRVRRVYDNTGAGDAVLAMLAAALAAGAELADAVRLANVAGGLEVERFGCVPISAEEVIGELRLQAQANRGKVRTLAELLPELARRRELGQTIVFTNGCFDLLHPGHLELLRRCRELGDMLVVGLNSDRSMAALGKGEDRPINPEHDRARMLSAIEYVDAVVLFDEPDPGALIRAVRPDVLVKGEDWAEAGVVGREFVESYGGRVVLVPLLEGYSTTALVERIRGKAAHQR